MEAIIDRIISFLKSDLPARLTLINTQYSASDTTKWTVPLTLVAPNTDSGYNYGPSYNILPLPSLQVFSRRRGYDPQAVANVSLQKIDIEIHFYFQTDFSETANRMSDRYIDALIQVMMNKRYLQNSTDGDHYAIEGQVESVEKVFVNAESDFLAFCDIQINLSYLCPTAVIENIRNID